FEGERKERGAEEEAVDSEEPDPGDQAGGGHGGDQKSEKNGSHSRYSQQPLALDLLAKLYGRPDFEDAGEDRPGSDQQNKHQCDRRRRLESDQASDDAQNSLGQEPLPAGVRMVCLRGGYAGDDAVDENVGAEQGHKRQ